jgi:hypothetical protein
MPGRGPTTFQKRQKEQQRKEKREEKLARRHQKKIAGSDGSVTDEAENPEQTENPEPSADGPVPQE